MENTQKTPEQWFQLLREPYRSEAIKGINKEVQYFKEYPESLLDALYFSLHWGKPFETTCNDWDVIYNSIKAGETTYLEPKTLKPEPIELRPEDLVSGEVYTYINIADEKSILKFSGKFNELEVYYHVKKHERGKIQYNDWVSVKGKFYHATPEEKKLLLGEEEPADWKAMYHDLKAKYDQLETKGEKVYFYFDEQKDHFCYYKELEGAISLSCNGMKIYEAVCIGKKKSVLVNETT